MRPTPTLLSSALLALFAAPALAQGGGSTWFPLTPGANPGTPADIQVIPAQTGAQQTRAQVTVHGYWLDTEPVPQGLPQQSVRIPGLHAFDLPGKPQLATARIKIAVPTDIAQVQVSEVYSQAFQQNAKIAPAPIPELDEELDGEQPGAGNPNGTPASYFLDPSIYGGDLPWPPPTSDNTLLPVGQALGHVPYVDWEVKVCRWNPSSDTLTVFRTVDAVFQHPGSVPQRAPMSKLKTKLAVECFINWDFIDTFFPGHNGTFSGRYLFVYPQAMLSELQPLIDQKKARGYAVSLITIESTLGTCSDIDNEIENWYYAGTADEQAGDNYCLLVGDVDRIPLCLDPDDGEPTDDIYASTNGDDLDEEIWLGRLSIDDATDLENQVAKILDYEDESLQSNAFEEVVLVADEQDAPGKYEEAHEVVRSASYTTPPTFTTIYGSTGASDADISAEIEAGIGLICYRGHGSSSSWSTWSTNGDSYHKDDVINLAEPIQTPVVWSISCTNSMLDYVGSTTDADCISETWMEEAESGAVAAYGSTVVSYTTANHELDKQLFDAVYDEELTTHAVAIADAEAEMTTFSPTSGARNSWRYLLLGDPEMTVRRDYTPVRIDPPGGGPIPNGPFDLDILFEDEFGNPIEEGLVSAWKSAPGGLDDVFINDYTDSSGLATLALDAKFEGLLHLVARDCVGNQAKLDLPVGCGPIAFGENLGGPNNLLLEHAEGLQPGDTVRTAISGGFAPGTPVLIAYATGQSQVPLLGGTVLIDPSKILQFQTTFAGPDGIAEGAIAVPPVPSIGSVSLFMQAFSPSGNEPGGWTLSNGLELSFCPIQG